MMLVPVTEYKAVVGPGLVMSPNVGSDTPTVLRAVMVKLAIGI